MTTGMNTVICTLASHAIMTSPRCAQPKFAPMRSPPQSRYAILVYARRSCGRERHGERPCCRPLRWSILFFIWIGIDADPPPARNTPITLCYLGLCAPILRSRASRGATLLPPSTLVDTFFYLDRHRRRPPPARNTPRRLARRPTGIAFAVNSECVYFEMDPVNDRRGSQDSTLAATTCSSPSAVVSHRPPPFRHIQVPLPL